jgi:uncharacterized protein (DUF2336 family)
MALIEHGDDKVAGQLLYNAGAEISDNGLNRIADRHGAAPAVQKGIIDRDALPATVIEKVVNLASSQLLTRLILRHQMPHNVSTQLVLEMRERATLGFSFGLSPDGMSNLADQLITENRLTQGLVLRCLTVGNIELIVHVIALRCQLGIDYVRDRLTRAAPAEMQKLWSAAELPGKYLALALAAINVLHETRGSTVSAPECQQKIAERFLAQGAEIERNLSPDDLAFLRSVRDGTAKNIASEAARA